MKKRIFTAVDISEAARLEVSEYIKNLRNEFPNLRVGWEKPEKLHLTLKFLGDIDAGQLEDLENAVLRAAKTFSELEKTENFKVQIADTGVFPSKRKARILWLGLQDENENLTKLNRILEAECEKIGFEKEKRNFSPHLTIGRLREPYKSEDLVEKHLENNFEPVGFVVSEIVIYESKLQPTGSIYKKVSNLRFQ